LVISTVEKRAGLCSVRVTVPALYSSPNIIRVIKSRQMGWAGHVARMGAGQVHTGLLWKDPMVTHQGADKKDNIKKDPKTWDG